MSLTLSAPSATSTWPIDDRGAQGGSSALTSGLIIPLYMYPGSAWNEVRNQKVLHPSVPVYAIMNPSNGVGSIIDSGYFPYLAQFRFVGIRILGYVATGYGTRSLAQVAAECSNYDSWYNTDGIFFDEWKSGYQPPPRMGINIGNPGTDSVPGPFPLITYETAGMPPPGFTGNYIAHTVPILPAAFPKPEYLYITDDPATYQRLPSYFAAEMAALDTGIVSPPPPPPPSTGTLTITDSAGRVYKLTSG